MLGGKNGLALLPRWMMCCGWPGMMWRRRRGMTVPAGERSVFTMAGKIIVSDPMYSVLRVHVTESFFEIQRSGMPKRAISSGKPKIRPALNPAIPVMAPQKTPAAIPKFRLWANDPARTRKAKQLNSRQTVAKKIAATITDTSRGFPASFSHHGRMSRIKAASAT